ncbi:hypothetical protein A3F66_05520 [candidate division TM6 bacterium RIFCSPHIGHO2_12_FULL_32_22]|nr:MAG: hypothetical protein A3F66_05520 [candidate division TM6 bacterium RIFCSPHIGHO2_12_FULL_32_22]
MKKIFLIMALISQLNSQDLQLLLSEDRQASMPLELAKKLPTLQNMLESSIDVDGVQISLPNISYTTHSTVVKLLKFLQDRDNSNKQLLIKREIRKNSSDNLADLVSALSFYDKQDLLLEVSKVLALRLQRRPNLLTVIQDRCSDNLDEVKRFLPYSFESQDEIDYVPDDWHTKNPTYRINRLYKWNKRSADGSITVRCLKPNYHPRIFNRNGEIIATLDDQKYVDYLISNDGKIFVALSGWAVKRYECNKELHGKDIHIYRITDNRLEEIGTIEDGYNRLHHLTADGSTIMAYSKRPADSKNSSFCIFNIDGTLRKKFGKKLKFQSVSSDGLVVLKREHSDKENHFYPGYYCPLSVYDKSGKLVDSICDHDYKSAVISKDGSTIVAQDKDGRFVYIYEKSDLGFVEVGCINIAGLSEINVSDNGAVVMAQCYEYEGASGYATLIFDKYGTLLKHIKNEDHEMIVDGNAIDICSKSFYTPTRATIIRLTKEATLNKIEESVSGKKN